MKADLKTLLRPHLHYLAPYSSARDEFSGQASVYLDANENPYTDPTGEPWNRYPDPHQRELKQQLAKIKGVSAEQIFLGNGSDEAIDLLIRAFCEPGRDKLLITVPTYGMYSVSAAINNVEVIEVLLNEDFQLRVPSLLKSVEERTKIIFLCSPNNPTGNLLKVDDIETILAEFNGLVVVDEAYIDFADSPSWNQRLAEFDNLVVLQTFSKAWGMAALRLGIAYAQPAIISVLNSIKPPYNISAYTQQHALSLLSQQSAVTQQVNDILAERANLREMLKALPQVEKVFPSDANFILIKVKQATQLYEYLLTQEIVVRNRSKVVLCDDCLRITVGRPKENKVLLTALQAWFSTQ